MDSAEDVTSVNAAHWDSLAAVHGEGQDRYYDLDALARGGTSLSQVERDGVAAAVGSVDGLAVLHVQCHIGMDSVSLARAGAAVTAVDFSATALEKAAALAARCGVRVEHVRSDVLHLPAELHGRFDLAYATIGILGWIGDVGQWMRSVGATLRPGGHLLLVDVHPLYAMLCATDPPVADFPYAFTGPVTFDEQGSYADPDAVLASSRTVEFAHSLGEVVTAAVESGLVVERVVEHVDSDFDPRGLLQAEDDGRFRLRVGGGAAPLLYTLVARRPS